MKADLLTAVAFVLAFLRRLVEVFFRIFFLDSMILLMVGFLNLYMTLIGFP